MSDFLLGVAIGGVLGALAARLWLGSWPWT